MQSTTVHATRSIATPDSPPPDATTLAHLAVLTTGALAGPATDTAALRIAVEDATHVTRLNTALELKSPDVVFAPRSAQRVSTSASVFGYRGGLSCPGDRFDLGGDRILEVEAYAVSRFLLVGGPTLIRVTGSEDLDVLAADADRARDTGLFPIVQTSPATQLADLPAFGYPSGKAAAGPTTRLYVRSDGAISVSPSGARLAHIEDPKLSRSTLAHTWEELGGGNPSCPLTLSESIDEAKRQAVLAASPWLPRFLAAVAAVRALRARGIVTNTVSGFGSRLSPQVPPEDGTAPSDRPVILWGASGTFVVDPLSARCAPLDDVQAHAFEQYLDGDTEADDPSEVLGARVGAALRRLGFKHAQPTCREVSA